MSKSQLVTDGSSIEDSHPTVEIDLSRSSIRWRWGCPNGHTTIEPTNGGIWCRSCSQAVDIDDPHHHEVVDKQTGEKVPWVAVELVNGDW